MRRAERNSGTGFLGSFMLAVCDGSSSSGSSILLAIVFGFEWNHSYYRGYYSREFRAPIFFALLVGGPLDAYLLSLLLTAFGKIAEVAEEFEEVPLYTLAEDVKKLADLPVGEHLRKASKVMDHALESEKQRQ